MEATCLLRSSALTTRPLGRRGLRRIRYMPPGGYWNNAGQRPLPVRLQANQMMDVPATSLAAQVGGFAGPVRQSLLRIRTFPDQAACVRLSRLLTPLQPMISLSFDPGYFNTFRRIELLSPLPRSPTGGALAINGPGRLF